MIGYNIAMKVSVLVATRNRARLLKHCLHSLQNQTTPPLEIVVVDNDSTDDTRTVCDGFKQTLPIVYQKERRVGLPFSRNRSLQFARGDLWAFIDDDCIANPEWLKQILAHFQQYPQTVGVIGITLNACPINISSCVEYVYYLRWLDNHVADVHDVGKLSSGFCIDFKNAAFRASFIKQFRFSTNAPYGDVGDEDVEIGYRLYRASQNIYYNPNIRVTHRYSTTIQRLFVRNFWNGYANQVLYRTHGLNVRTFKPKFPTNQSALVKHKVPSAVSYKIIRTIYPLFSRFGRLYALTNTKKLSIPKRT